MWLYPHLPCDGLNSSELIDGNLWVLFSFRLAKHARGGIGSLRPTVCQMLLQNVCIFNTWSKSCPWQLALILLLVTNKQTLKLIKMDPKLNIDSCAWMSSSLARSACLFSFSRMWEFCVCEVCVCVCFQFLHGGEKVVWLRSYLFGSTFLFQYAFLFFYFDENLSACCSESFLPA